MKILYNEIDTKVYHAIRERRYRTFTHSTHRTLLVYDLHEIPGNAELCYDIEKNKESYTVVSGELRKDDIAVTVYIDNEKKDIKDAYDTMLTEIQDAIDYIDANESITFDTFNKVNAAIHYISDLEKNQLIRERKLLKYIYNNFVNGSA